jgi:hypothetical protein
LKFELIMDSPYSGLWCLRANELYDLQSKKEPTKIR